MVEQTSSSSRVPGKAMTVVSINESEVSSSALDSVPATPFITHRDSASLDFASKRRFRSYRLRGSYEKPWLSDPAMKKTKLNDWIVRAFILLGFILAGLSCFLTVWPYKQNP
ncbi:hypothetical protein E4U53_003930, partial [Claviceps sorghi]